MPGALDAPQGPSCNSIRCPWPYWLGLCTTHKIQDRVQFSLSCLEAFSFDDLGAVCDPLCCYFLTLSALEICLREAITLAWLWGGREGRKRQKQGFFFFNKNGEGLCTFICKEGRESRDGKTESTRKIEALLCQLTSCVTLARRLTSQSLLPCMQIKDDDTNRT